MVISLCILLFCGWTVYHIGSRDLNIGIDTLRYSYAFEFYKASDYFTVRKDFFYDYLNYSIAHLFNDFFYLLTLCSFIYVFGTYYGLRKIFDKTYFLPLLLFLMSPDFIDYGINVMRSGVAGSIFLVGLAFYYKQKRMWLVYLIFILSVLFHISFVVTLICFIATYYLKNTKILFLCWVGSFVLYLLNINILSYFINLLDELGVFNSFTERSDGYINAEENYNSWYYFFMFGLLPIGFAAFNILQLKYKNEFYIRLTNIYLLVFIPVTILMDTRYAYRIGYLAEFMMPVILLFPLLIEPKIKIKYLYFKLSICIFVLFLIKAYKILII